MLKSNISLVIAIVSTLAGPLVGYGVLKSNEANHAREIDALSQKLQIQENKIQKEEVEVAVVRQNLADISIQLDHIENSLEELKRVFKK